MKRLWTFVSTPANLAVLVALAGGLGFFWEEVIGPKLNPKPPTPPTSSEQVKAKETASQNAQASQGGIAINAAGEAKVNVNGDSAARK